MMKIQLLISLLSGLAIASPLQADILRIDQNSLDGNVIAAENAPRRGMSKAAVVKKYGPPSERTATVGIPPISSWIYPSYRVYFEYDHVIHTVNQ